MNWRRVGFSVAIAMVTVVTNMPTSIRDCGTDSHPASAANMNPPIGNPDHAISYIPASRPRMSSDMDICRTMFPSPTCMALKSPMMNASVSPK